MSRAADLPSLPFRGAGAALAVVFTLAAASQIKLQLFERKSTVALGEATNRFTVTRTEPAERGSILTADGVALAEDTGQKELTLDYKRLPGAPAFYIDLAAATGLPAVELAPPHAGVRSRTWTGSIGPENALRIREVQRLWRADGVSLRSQGERAYPMGEIASGIVGLQRELDLAKKGEKPRPKMVRIGLERSMQAELQGRDGYERGLADKNGIMLPLRTTGNRIERRDGETVVLTLDSTLQSIASKAIRKAVEGFGAIDGVAIVIDPSTGDIKAMANWPSFNPSGAGDNKEVGYNPATMGVFEPGSTFKVLTLAKALDEGTTAMSAYTHCGGTLAMNAHWKVSCDMHGGSRAHGDVDPTKAIAKSCNVAAASWALRIGHQGFTDYMRDLGLFHRTRIGLPNETWGSYYKDEHAKRLQLANFGFGQAISITPLGLAGAYGALANGGVRRAPRLIQSIGTRKLPLEPGRRVLGERACLDVRNAMEAVIETDGGTGKTLRIPGYRLAGKTGTAEKIGKGQSGFVASFVGMVPSRKPQAVILVMVNKPVGPRYYGAQVAGPVFKSLAQGVIDRYRIKPDAQAEAMENPKGPSIEVSAEPVTLGSHRDNRSG